MAGDSKTGVHSVVGLGLDVPLIEGAGSSSEGKLSTEPTSLRVPVTKPPIGIEGRGVPAYDAALGIGVQILIGEKVVDQKDSLSDVPRKPYRLLV